MVVGLGFEIDDMMGVVVRRPFEDWNLVQNSARFAAFILKYELVFRCNCGITTAAGVGETDDPYLRCPRRGTYCGFEIRFYVLCRWMTWKL